jgi:hypothetical protein
VATFIHILRRAASISGGDVGSDLELSRELKVAL